MTRTAFSIFNDRTLIKAIMYASSIEYKLEYELSSKSRVDLVRLVTS